MDEKRLKSNINKFYLYNICTGMFFFVPIMVLFWQDNGLSITEVMLLQSIFSLFTVIFEIPSGYFADIFGRKKTLVLASLTGFLAMFFYSLGHNFFHFVIAEFFFALSVSFTSGTKAAFLFDTLKNLGQEKQFKKIWGNALFFGMLAMAFSNVLGGLLAKIDFRFTFYASLPFFALMVPFTMTFEEPIREQNIIASGYVKRVLISIKDSLVTNRRLRWIIIYSGIIYTFNQVSLWLYQPYFSLSGLDIPFFGVVFALFQVVAAFSAKFAHKIEHKLGQRYSMLLLTILLTISYLLMSNFVYLFSFSFCFLHQFIRGFKKTVISDYINNFTTSELRATVLSTESFISRLLYAMVIPIFGWIVDIYTLIDALKILGVTTLVCGSVVLVILKRQDIL